MIEAICFDIGETLIETQDSGFCTRLAKSIGYSVDDLRPYLEKHFLTKEIIYEEALHDFFDEIDVPESSSRYGLDLLQTPCLYRAYNDVIPTLQRLSSYKLSILSNSTPWEVVNLEDIGIAKFMDAIIYSFKIGVAKPDIQAYRAVENALGIASQSIAMVGDSKVDMDGARQAGWLAIYIKRNPIKEPKVDSDIVISELSNLPDILQALYLKNP